MGVRQSVARLDPPALPAEPPAFRTSLRARRAHSRGHPGRLGKLNPFGARPAGRFVMFFWRDDADIVALGLDQAQVVSLVLLAAALAGL